MNNKAFTISLALAGIAVFMIYSYIASKEEEIKNEYGQPVSVIVAKRDIKELGEIHENMVEAIPRPKKFLEPGHTTTKDEVVGFIAAVPIRKGEQVTLNKVIAPGISTGLSKQVTPGKRAVAVRVDEESAVNKLIKPGDRVDIIATIEPPGAPKGSQISKMILQDIPVLAVGEFITAHAPRKIEKDDITGKENVRNLNVEKNFNTITVEVEPQYALQLALLKDARAGLTIILRNNDDTERVNMGATTLPDLLGGEASRILRGPAAQR